MTPLTHQLSRRANTIGELWAVLRMVPRKPNKFDKADEWRLINPPQLGFFAPLVDTTTSIALATNGVHIIAERMDGRIIEGHITNWTLLSKIKAPTLMDDPKNNEGEARTTSKSNGAAAGITSKRALEIEMLVSQLMS